MLEKSWKFSVLTILFTLNACGFLGASNNLDEQLANQGPIPLSADNPYVGTNYYLAQQMEKNAQLRGFIKHQGTPDAIEIRARLFRSLRVYLFYLDKHEAFLLEESNGDWIILGPERIPQSILVNFDRMTPVGRHAPLSTSKKASGKVTKDDEESISTLSWGEDKTLPTVEQAKVSELPPPVRAAKQSAKKADKPVAKVKTSAADSKIAPLPPASKNASPEVIDELSEVSNVDESPSGDIIHHVSFPGETLRIIAEWYTGDKNNANRLTRINEIAKPETLQLGQRIRIPRYLLKTMAPLPRSHLGSSR